MPYQIDPKTKKRIDFDVTTGKPVGLTMSNNTPAVEKKPGFFQKLIQPTIDYVKKETSKVQTRNTGKTIKERLKQNFSPAEVISNLPVAGLFLDNQDGKVAFDPVGAKAAANVASFAVPGGGATKGVLGAGKAAAMGAVSGGLYAGSQDEDILKGAAGGAAGGLIFKGGESVVRGTKNLFRKKGAELAEKASANILKTSGSVHQKASDFGMDLNEIVKKHGLAIPYEESIGATGKGGGVVQAKLTAAEKAIQGVIKSNSNIKVSSDDFVSALMKERKLLGKTVGNKSKVAALEEIIKETKKMFKNGMSPARLLTLKRAADGKFGKGVVEEGVGSISASAQKMMGNAARKKLKQMFPEIADALETQSELLTIKPVLERARSKVATSGVKLSQFDLTKPGTWIDPLLNNPEFASKLINAGDNMASLPAPVSPMEGFLKQKMVDTTRQSFVTGGAEMNTPTAPMSVPPTTSPTTPTVPPVSPPGGEMITIQNEQTGETKQVSKAELPQYGFNDDESAMDQPSEEMIKQAIIKASMKNDSKSVTSLTNLMKVLYPAEKPLTGQQIKDMNNASTAVDNLAEVRSMLEGDQSLLIKAALPGKLGARTFNRKIEAIADVYARLRTGATLNEAEMKFYPSQLPGLLDYGNPEAIDAALQMAESFFNKVANQQPGVSDVVGNNFSFSAGDNPLAQPY